MKKVLFFTIYAVCLCSAFMLLVRFEETPGVAIWIKSHDYYFAGLISLMFVGLGIAGYLQNKKYQLQQLEIKKQGIKPIRLNDIKTNPFLLAISGLLIFCGGTLLVLYLRREDFTLLLSGLIVTYLGAIAILFWALERAAKWKLERSAQIQESLSLKLRSIRSQLNPHFMFNALTSIQNLMNKSDIQAANHYLTMFADLTRRVLNTSDQELISLEDELKILEDYLQMEQLRFGFQYKIEVDENINIANTEIPAMLLQPFVENAVKHGVAVLHQSGVIKLQINKHQNDLILILTDNGPGFDKVLAQKNTNSFGLKLSEERIALLNQIHPDQSVMLNIDAKQTGTIITITLANLLS